jgi:hypothetical protein
VLLNISVAVEGFPCDEVLAVASRQPKILTQDRKRDTTVDHETVGWNPAPNPLWFWLAYALEILQHFSIAEQSLVCCRNYEHPIAKTIHDQQIRTQP